MALRDIRANCAVCGSAIDAETDYIRESDIWYCSFSCYRQARIA